eukprot:SAG22_NODE_1317_length_4765_cov_2.131590_5_plen_74_part_00
MADDLQPAVARVAAVASRPSAGQPQMPLSMPAVTLPRRREAGAGTQMNTYALLLPPAAPRFMIFGTNGAFILM